MTERRLQVLLVEDEPLNRALVRAIVARQIPASDGVVLLEAATIGEARQILEREPIDVLLLDVRLPDGSGLDLAEELRNDPGRGDDAASAKPMPMIAILSASVLAEEREAAETSGADAFLAKPFVPRELVALIARFGATVWERRLET